MRLSLVVNVKRENNNNKKMNALSLQCALRWEISQLERQRTGYMGIGRYGRKTGYMTMQQQLFFSFAGSGGGSGKRIESLGGIGAIGGAILGSWVRDGARGN